MTDKKFRMEVDCDQDWDAMTPTSCGRFCSVCDKVVIDLRGRSYEEIKQLRQGSRICGIFLPEQVEEDIVPIEITVPKKIKLWMAAAVAFMGLELGAAHAQSKGQDTVQVIQGKKDQAAPALNEPPGTVVKERDEEAEDIVTAPALSGKSRSKYYVSKRFPFIHKRRKKFHVMGCPSF